MAIELTTRTTGISLRNDPFRGGLAGSFIFHGVLAALIVGWGFYIHTGQNWGGTNPNTGTVQATMVNSLPPLKPQPPAPVENVLATENPSPAPAPPTPKAAPIPQPNAIPIPAKPTKPPKVAERTVPPPPLHPQPVTPPTNQVTTGEAPASLPVSAPTQAGTVSIQAQDAAFGARYAYYVRGIVNKVAEQWYVGMLDPQAYGHRVYITFQIERDGTPTHIQIAQRSGDGTLDQTALSAVEHVDTFGPLPDGYSGSHLDVTYYFDPPPHR